MPVPRLTLNESYEGREDMLNRVARKEFTTGWLFTANARPQLALG
jgi:hypothetical protein